MAKVTVRERVNGPQELMNKFLSPVPVRVLRAEPRIDFADRGRVQHLTEELAKLDLPDLCVTRELLKRAAKNDQEHSAARLDTDDFANAKRVVDEAIQDRSGGKLRPQTIVGNIAIMALARGRAFGALESSQNKSPKVAGGVEKSSGIGQNRGD